MTPEQHDRALFEVGMVLLGASNLVGEAGTSLGGDEELAALNNVLLWAHLFMQEKVRSLHDPNQISAAVQVDDLSTRRGKLAESLRAAADLFAFNADERPETAGQNVAAEQRIVTARLTQFATA